MRNEDLATLELLVGAWDTTLSDAWFLEPRDLEVPGSATCEWLGEAFLIFRWTMEGDVGTATSEQTLVLGRSDARDEFTVLYHDERGVCRVFEMTFADSLWVLNREDPDMFQRFIADVTPDRIMGRWEASQDRGATWRKDFDLTFTRR